MLLGRVSSDLLKLTQLGLQSFGKFVEIDLIATVQRVVQFHESIEQGFSQTFGLSRLGIVDIKIGNQGIPTIQQMSHLMQLIVCLVQVTRLAGLGDGLRQ